MKKLTQVQLSEVGAYNEYFFCGPHGWYINYGKVSDSRHSYWQLQGQAIPCNDFFGNGIGIIDGPRNKFAKPGEFIELIVPAVNMARAELPKEWIKFMGVWMDKAMYEDRMAYWVDKYQKIQDGVPTKEAYTASCEYGDY